MTNTDDKFRIEPGTSSNSKGSPSFEVALEGGASSPPLLPVKSRR